MKDIIFLIECAVDRATRMTTMTDVAASVFEDGTIIVIRNNPNGLNGHMKFAVETKAGNKNPVGTLYCRGGSFREKGGEQSIFEYLDELERALKIALS